MRKVPVREAAVLLHTARRIMVIGCSGSGKSTLSRRICGRFVLPYVSMDRDIFWLPGWVMRERADIIAKVEFYASGSAWVFDGNNCETMPYGSAAPNLCSGWRRRGSSAFSAQ